ncbi:hypothetical protein [Sporosarcina sp. ACRSL]
MCPISANEGTPCGLVIQLSTPLYMLQYF